MLIRKDAICQVENYQGDRIDALCRMEESSETFRYAGRMGNLISSVLEEDPDSYYAFIIGELIAQSENR